MSELLIRFAVRLDIEHLPDTFRARGPLFYRWLPEGDADAIRLKTKDPDAQLDVWFERFGFVDDRGYIRFDVQKREVDPKIVARQAVLTGGPLLGRLSLPKVSQKERTALKSNRLGDPHYLSLGRRIVNLLQSPVSNFIEIIRMTYGQYWIPSLAAWNSTKESLGQYCRKLETEWSLDGNIWSPFRPDDDPIRLPIAVRDDDIYSLYLSRGDWSDVASLAETEYEPSFSHKLLMEAHELLDAGNLKYALIQAVTALEIAVGELLRGRLKEFGMSNKELQDGVLNSWTNQSLRVRLVLLASILGEPSSDDIESAIECVELRHRVIHEGWRPAENDPQLRDSLAKLLGTVALLIPQPTPRFPSAYPLNKLF